MTYLDIANTLCKMKRSLRKQQYAIFSGSNS